VNDLPRLTEIVAVWIGRDEETGNPAAILQGRDDSQHYAMLEDGDWKLLAIDANGEYRVADEPVLQVDPLRIAIGIVEGTGGLPLDPNMN
jgi:hypothetical protein